MLVELQLPGPVELRISKEVQCELDSALLLHSPRDGLSGDPLMYVHADRINLDVIRLRLACPQQLGRNPSVAGLIGGHAVVVPDLRRGAALVDGQPGLGVVQPLGVLVPVSTSLLSAGDIPAIWHAYDLPTPDACERLSKL